MLPLLFALALHAAPAAAAPAPAATPAVEPKIGDAAPAIELPNPQGGNFSLAALAGKTVVVVFYPKAFTGGWTRELSAYRDQHDAFAQRDAQVVGISQDDAATAEKFRESLKLPFPLLGDPDAKVSRAWGVSAGSYAKRVTFVVGPDGKIVHVEHDKLEPSGAIDACPLSHRPEKSNSTSKPASKKKTR